MFGRQMSSLLLMCALAICVGVTTVEGEPGDRSFGPAPPGDAGRLFFVNYEEIQCLLPPCPAWVVTAENGAISFFTNLDLSAMGMDEAHETQVRAEIAAGMWLVRARVGERKGPRATLNVLGLESPVRYYHVHYEEIECVVAPCPNWVAVDENGATSYFTGLDLSALDLDEEQEAQLIAEIADGLWSVRATPSDPIGPQFTLVVFELLARPIGLPD